MGGYFVNIHCYHVLINYFIIIEVIIEADSTPDMDETVCYGSDEEENDSDITYVESTDEEIDNIVNNPPQHAIVQQGPSQQGQVTRGQLIRCQQIRGQPTMGQISRGQPIMGQLSRGQVNTDETMSVQASMGQLNRGQRKSHVKLITILWKCLNLTVKPIAMQILISLHTQKVTNIFPKCQHNVQHIQK